jgi:OPA family sugar phosphate sensor protein UhpC-like MFS transporter
MRSLRAITAFFATGAPSRAPVPAGRVDAVFRRHRLQILAAITLGYGLTYTCRLVFGVIKKPLIDSGTYSASQLGAIGAALFYSYAFGKLTNGFLADHLNARRFMALGFLLSALCNFAMAGGLTPGWAVGLWALNGWVQSFGAPASVVALTAWFSSQERGRAYGVWATSHSIGEGATFGLIGVLVAHAGWQAGFLGAGIIGLAVALLALTWVQDRPVTLGLPTVADWKGDQASVGGAVALPPFEVLSRQLKLLASPALLILALASALAYVTRYAMNSWGVLYLQEDRGLSVSTASALLMASNLTGIVGAVGYGFISDVWFKSRRPPANLLFGLAELAGLGLIFHGPNTLPVLATGMLLFGIGMTGLVTALGGLFGVDIAPRGAAGAALGIVGVFSYLGAAIQEQVSGRLIEAGTHVVGGVRLYDFQAVTTFWIAASVASLVLATCLWRVEYKD